MMENQKKEQKSKLLSVRNILFVAVLALITVFLIAQFRNKPTGQPTAGVEPETTPTSHPAAPEAAFLDQEGQLVALSSLKGKVVFINFWATWCPPCIAEMPSINKLYQKYQNNAEIVFLMVDMDNKPEASKAFMQKNGYVLPVHTPHSEVPRAYFSGSLPTTVILDKNGKIAAQQIGAADFENPEVFAFLDSLLR